MTELISVPEERVLEVVDVIRAGLRAVPQNRVSRETKRNLNKWCNDAEEYHNESIS